MEDKLIGLNQLKVYDKDLKAMACLLQREYDYSLGDVVNKGKISLKCILAGKTSPETLSLSGVSVGDELVDGTVRWKVVEQIDTSKFVIKEVQGPNGRALFFNEEDGGGNIYTNTTDKTVSFVGVNDGSYDINVQIYAKSTVNNVGTRLNVSTDGIYYTKNKNNSSYTAKDEVATVSMLGSQIKNWESEKEYAIGDLVIYNSMIYQCKTANSDIVFTKSNWNELGYNGVTTWESSKVYTINNMVMHDGDLYICITNHTSTVNFEDDSVNWKNITSSSGNTYLQVNKLDITAPQTLEIAINKTNTFLRPPLEILKLNAGESDITQNQFDFSAGDGSKFTIDGVTAKDSPYIIFDGVAKVNHNYTYELEEPVQMVDGYYSETDYIDFSKFKVIDEVSLV